MIARTAILALSLALAGTPALAATADEAPTATIRIDDLKLTSAKGRERLEARVHSAARQICATSARGLAARNSENACMATALAAAKPQMERAIARADGGTQLALLMIKPGR
ncbi:UrcA family protein [Sphingopyxis sp. MC1]|uniref:UrcA family protein n=1 Tax=Sphingopyxis sp. MC1 TaxID=1174684 RepID=UPI0002D1692A|nr:UrcA family protein [Sphingopyxis sp. MC1]ENY81409.1 hypothetical protein EBMC1_10154 [Sphingopyxis sp. MC1]